MSLLNMQSLNTMSSGDKEKFIIFKPSLRSYNFLFNNNINNDFYTFKPELTSEYELHFIKNLFDLYGNFKSANDFAVLRGITLDQWKQLGFEINEKYEITNYNQFTFLFPKRDFRQCYVFLNNEYKGYIFIKNNGDGWFHGNIIF